MLPTPSHAIMYIHIAHTSVTYERSYKAKGFLHCMEPGGGTLTFLLKLSM